MPASGVNDRNFDAAEIYLAQAKEADAAGDENRCRAALYMMTVALALSGPSPRIHVGHLKS